jgi:3-hydroxyisobutyrate dehydrogenase
MSRIAFVGTGAMGSGMARRMLGAGHDVVVHNRTRDKLAPLVEAGARAADTPASAAEDADALIVMVADDAASRNVWLGDDGLLAGTPAPGAFAIECSTLSHEWVLELASAARHRGLRYVDAPVTGLPDAAAAGRLTLLVGAEDDDWTLARDLLAPLHDNAFLFGPVGAGTAYKLMVNLMGAIQIGAAAEGLALAQRAGLDPCLVASALASGQAASPQVVRTSARMARGGDDEPIVFSGLLRHKDTSYALRMARDLGIDVPLGRAALAGLEELLSAGLGDRDETTILEVARLREWAADSLPAAGVRADGEAS